jgi:ABC-type oligopeptide transport system substrate-binding subunit
MMKRSLTVFVAAAALICILQLSACSPASSGENAAATAEKAAGATATDNLRSLDDARRRQLQCEASDREPGEALPLAA